MRSQSVRDFATLRLGVRFRLPSNTLTHRREAAKILFKLDEQEARRRMQTVNEILARNHEQSPSLPAGLYVSVGVSGFDSMKDLGQAIEQADQAMYQSRKFAREAIAAPPLSQPENAATE